jgi:antitoxin (DNA-binding transcriptional repressor) of toxin-antitoxin stability system
MREVNISTLKNNFRVDHEQARYGEELNVGDRNQLIAWLNPQPHSVVAEGEESSFRKKSSCLMI